MGQREEAVKLISSFSGVSVSNDRARYVDLLGPDETKAMQDYFCDPKTSGCALVIRGLWRKLGVTDKRVLPDYVFGSAIASLVGIARARKAWTISCMTARPGASVSLLPKPGDFVLVGGDPTKDGGVEHVFTVVSIEPQDDGTITLTSVDGGQRDSQGQQAILAKRRRWIPRANGMFWDVSSAGNDPGASAPGGRRVQGWGDLEKILAAEVKSA